MWNFKCSYTKCTFFKIVRVMYWILGATVSFLKLSVVLQFILSWGMLLPQNCSSRNHPNCVLHFFPQGLKAFFKIPHGSQNKFSSLTWAKKKRKSYLNWSVSWWRDKDTLGFRQKSSHIKDSSHMTHKRSVVSTFSLSFFKLICFKTIPEHKFSIPVPNKNIPTNPSDEITVLRHQNAWIGLVKLNTDIHHTSG